MKLESYAMLVAFQSQDWPAALKILQDHFGIVLPYSFEISPKIAEIYCARGYQLGIVAEETSAFGDATKYSWSERGGFNLHYSFKSTPLIKIWHRPASMAK